MALASALEKIAHAAGHTINEQAEMIHHAQLDPQGVPARRSYFVPSTSNPNHQGPRS
jgi:hypothetical protein